MISYGKLLSTVVVKVYLNNMFPPLNGSSSGTVYPTTYSQNNEIVKFASFV